MNEFIALATRFFTSKVGAMNNLQRHNVLCGRDQKIAFIKSLIKSYRITHKDVGAIQGSFVLWSRQSRFFTPFGLFHIAFIFTK